ncbi:ATP-binding cassette domain-containing protein [Streptomyces sp. NPDC056669]|uniref:ATP-binding cassette domain-containing protein n=1 Tax=Streptomyces sp. NPDC056669 TaxID=3345903 RepID=UPI0036AADD3B
MRLRGVGRRYGLGGPWVLRDVDLEVPPGSLTRVEGRNGSGKSTLLRLLAGIDAPSTGRITGRPATAYVPERFPAELPFSALGYLTHLGRIHGLSRAAAARGAGEWLERFGADGYAGTPLAELSKGTSQKIAVAQALLAAPGLLVLDEAWTGLDQAARGVLDASVADRVADGGAVVFVDHDPRRLAGAPDRVLRVAETRLVPVDTEAPGTAVPPGREPAPRGGRAPAPAVPGPSASAGERPSPAGTRPGRRSMVPAAPGPSASAGERPSPAGMWPGRRSMVPADAWVRVEAEGTPGAELPAGLPGGAVREYCPAAQGSWSGKAPAGPAGHQVVRLTVAATHSDALLRTLLTAAPPWHIRTVTTVSDTHERTEAPQEPTEAPHEAAEVPRGLTGVPGEPVEFPREPAESASLREPAEGAQEPNKAPQEAIEALHGPVDGPKETA